MTQSLRFRVTGVLISLLLAGCQAASPSGTPAGSAPAGTAPASAIAATPQTLVYAVSTLSFEGGFDPHRMNSGQLTWAAAMYDTLVRQDPADVSKIAPSLATSWEANSDNTVFTFHLRKDVVFSTGNPLTAADVKFSLDRLWAIQSPVSTILSTYKSIDVVDTYTVRFTTKSPDASFLVRLAGPQCGILDSSIAKSHGALSEGSAVPTADTALSFFNTPTSIGSGPFMLGSYVPNDRVILVRNPKYWGARPALDKVIIQLVPETATQSQLLQAGSIDIATGLDFATSAQLEKASGVNVSYAKSTTNMVVLFMTASKDVSAPLSNKVVRQAVQRAIDYDGLMQLANGHASKPATTIPVGLLGCCGIPAVKQDLDKAKSLLASAGYANGFDVTFSYANQIRFNVNFQLIAAKIQSDLARVGIRVTLSPYGTETEFLTKYRAAVLQMGISGIGGFSDPDAFVGDIWVSSHNFVTKRLWFKSDAIDSLYPQSLSTSGAAREAIYTQLQGMFQDEAAVEGVIQPDFILASRSSVSGYQYRPQSFVDFSTISNK
jgi:peptide/nickel transport system substrate-binding protein